MIRAIPAGQRRAAVDNSMANNYAGPFQCPREDAMGKQVTAPARWGGRSSRWKRRRHTLTMGRVMDVTEEVLDAREKAREMAEEGSDVHGGDGAGRLSSKSRRTDWSRRSSRSAMRRLDSRPESRDFPRPRSRASLAARSRPASADGPRLDHPVGRKGSKAGLCPFPELGRELQEAWGEGAGAPLKIINRLAEVPILIRDDGRREDDGLCVAKSAYLLFQQAGAKRAVCPWTSNLTIEQIEAKLTTGSFHAHQGHSATWSR